MDLAQCKYQPARELKDERRKYLEHELLYRAKLTPSMRPFLKTYFLLIMSPGDFRRRLVDGAEFVEEKVSGDLYKLTFTPNWKVHKLLSVDWKELRGEYKVAVSFRHCPASSLPKLAHIHLIHVKKDQPK